MPRSKKRVSKKDVSPPAIKFDDVLTAWTDEYVLRSKNPDVGLLGAATALWVGVGDPDKRGVNQCTAACGIVQGVLDKFGYSSKIVPVLVVTSRPGERDRMLGTPEPSSEGMNWSGHCVLWVPGMSIIFDPTIGQAKMATSKKLHYPVVMQDAALAAPPPIGSVFTVKRQDVTFDYRIIPDNGSLGTALEMQRASVRETAQLVDADFRQTVADLQEVARKNAGT